MTSAHAHTTHPLKLNMCSVVLLEDVIFRASVSCNKVGYRKESWPQAPVIDILFQHIGFGLAAHGGRPREEL